MAAKRTRNPLPAALRLQLCAIRESLAQRAALVIHKTGGSDAWDAGFRGQLPA